MANIKKYLVIEGTSIEYSEKYGPQQTESISKEVREKRLSSLNEERVFVIPTTAKTVNEVAFNQRHQGIGTGIEAELISEKTYQERLTQKLTKGRESFKQHTFASVKPEEGEKEPNAKDDAINPQGPSS